jgi:hypothetical protein
MLSLVAAYSVIDSGAGTRNSPDMVFIQLDTREKLYL